MIEKLNLIGAAAAHIILVSSILTFALRMVADTGTGHWTGIPILLMAVPLVYLLVRAPGAHRPVLYYIQVSLMLVWLIMLFLVDYYPKYNFRQTRWMVITFVVVFFGGTGGMIGVASLAGKGWTISAVVLFLASFVLAFVQRSVTGY